MIEFLRRVFGEASQRSALRWRGGSFTYEWLDRSIDSALDYLATREIGAGRVIGFEGEYSPHTISFLLALIESGQIIVPFTGANLHQRDEFLRVAEVEFNLVVGDDGVASLDPTGVIASHALYTELRRREHPGLVVFTSGSTGKAKAAVHDFVPLLEKFHLRRQRFVTIPFLLFDHLGGVNTLLYSLSNGGELIIPADRTPDQILDCIERYKVDMLPTSPTFMNFICLSELYQGRDLSSLKLVTYGTEPMPMATLKRFREIFPWVTLQQTYGLTELGVMRSKSRSSDSLWVKVGGEGFETRVVDGMLEIKARSAMLGYLNAPSPFTDDGWYKTGDEVEVDGEYVKFLGRRSEIINVGGQKVFPAEVESVILEIPEISEATVWGKRNPITGNTVCARVTVHPRDDTEDLSGRIKSYCRQRLEKFKVPVKVEVITNAQHNARFKKMRNQPGMEGS